MKRYEAFRLAQRRANLSNTRTAVVRMPGDDPGYRVTKYRDDLPKEWTLLGLCDPQAPCSQCTVGQTDATGKLCVRHGKMVPFMAKAGARERKAPTTRICDFCENRRRTKPVRLGYKDYDHQLCAACRKGTAYLITDPATLKQGEPAMNRRGRPPGSGTGPTGPRPGTFGGWLLTAKPGAVWWSERDSRNLAGDAFKAKRTVKTSVYYAVAPTGKGQQDVHALKLTRVEMIGDADDDKR